MIKLAEAHRHLAAARTGSCDNHQRTHCLHIVVTAETVFRVDESHIVGISFDDAMVIYLDAEALEATTVGVGAGLAVVVGNHHRTHHETTVHKLLAQTQHVDVVGNAQVAAHLILFNIAGTDDDNDFSDVGKLKQHLQLDVGLEARQHAAGVEVVEQLSAKLQIQLIAELGDTFFNMF